MNKYADFLQKKNAINNVLSSIISSNEYFKGMFNENGVDSYDEFLKIPYTSKATLRSEKYLKNVMKNAESCKLEITSGSTGEPLKCYKTSSEIMKLNLIIWQNRKRIDNEVNIKNFFSMYGMDTRKKIGDLVNLEKENMLSCLKKILDEKPRWLYGSVSVVEQYAKIIKEFSLKNETIKYIELAGESIDSQIREYIEAVFGAKVINHYGMRENWCIAYECSCGKMHVCDNVFVENDENGELIVTNTVLQTMPVIRYRTGDMGRIEYEECQCGQKGAVIYLSGGRMGQIISGNKNVLGDIFFKRLFSRVLVDGFEGIRSYNVEQYTEKDFNIKIVYDDYVSESEKDSIENKIDGMIKQRLNYDKLVIAFERLHSVELINGKRVAFKNMCKGR